MAVGFGLGGFYVCVGGLRWEKAGAKAGDDTTNSRESQRSSDEQRGWIGLRLDLDSRVSTWHWFWEILGLWRITDNGIGCDVDTGLDYLISIKVGKSLEQRMQRIRIHDLDHQTIQAKPSNERGHQLLGVWMKILKLKDRLAGLESTQPKLNKARSAINNTIEVEIICISQPT